MTKPMRFIARVKRMTLEDPAVVAGLIDLLLSPERVTYAHPSQFETAGMFDGARVVQFIVSFCRVFDARVTPSPRLAFGCTQKQMRTALVAYRKRLAEACELDESAYFSFAIHASFGAAAYMQLIRGAIEVDEARTRGMTLSAMSLAHQSYEAQTRHVVLAPGSNAIN